MDKRVDRFSRLDAIYHAWDGGTIQQTPRCAERRTGNQWDVKHFE